MDRLRHRLFCALLRTNVAAHAACSLSLTPSTHRWLTFLVPLGWIAVVASPCYCTLPCSPRYRE